MMKLVFPHQSAFTTKYLVSKTFVSLAAGDAENDEPDDYGDDDEEGDGT
jgi:hypothetical protein